MDKNNFFCWTGRECLTRGALLYLGGRYWHKLINNFLRSSNLKCSKQTSVSAVITSSLPLFQRIAWIHFFPLEANGGRFLSFLVAFRNTTTRRHGETEQTTSTTKQNFSGDALSKQLTEASLTSLSCNLSRVPTKWSAIFARSILLLFICYLRAICDENTNIFWVRNERVGQSRSCSPAMYIDCCTSYRKKKVCESNFVLKFSLLIFIHICNDS